MSRFSSNGIITASLNDILMDFESLISRTRAEDSTQPIVPAPGNNHGALFVTDAALDSTTLNGLMALSFSKADLNLYLALCVFVLLYFFSFVPPEDHISETPSDSQLHLKIELDRLK